jgi:hypothetical protein
MACPFGESTQFIFHCIHRESQSSHRHATSQQLFTFHAKTDVLVMAVAERG